MNIRKACSTGLVSLFLTVPAMAGSHSWRFSELYSNANGMVQFIEMTCPVSLENGVNGLQITVVVAGNTVNTFTIPNPSLPGSTANKKLLLATNGYAALPGGPARDYTIPANFLPTSGTFTLRYNPGGNYDTNVVSAGSIPLDGVNSLQYTSFLGGNGVDTFTNNTPNNPANYTTGIPGSVNGSCLDGDIDGYGNPGDPDCTGGPQTDCNDNNAAINPGETEVCNDVIDNDCNLLADCVDQPACATTCPTVSEWGVLAMALLTLNAGSVLIRRRM